jgi:ubiquitin carboxyl-terminal hydrolase 5/13
LEECACVANLDQSNAVKIANESLAKCGECDIKTNLWMCMHCGHLGCGRKYYDGSGGNNHGVDHGKNHNHPVVCKMGTITPEGGASIYCYKCDDDVLDTKLEQHMHTLGVNIATQIKTEKTMTELNLEANLNFTLSKVIEAGIELIPLFGPGNTGMDNLGNSCYMNSVV